MIPWWTNGMTQVDPVMGHEHFVVVGQREVDVFVLCSQSRKV